MIFKVFLLAISSVLYFTGAQAQGDTSPHEPDNSGEQAEAREDAYRKRMELEGSRDPDSFSNTTYTSEAKLEKIDKLPRESRDNIREQLTDVIIENVQWEPFDALREYPYEPTEAAQEDPGLRMQEQEAWAEQMEKYHKREASAFEASRPSMPDNDPRQTEAGPESGSQQELSQNASEGKEEAPGDNQGDEGGSEGETGQPGSPESSASSARSYDPYQSSETDDTDELSTAGVSENALDFLKARQDFNTGPAGKGAGSDETEDQRQEVAQAEDGAVSGAATVAENSQDFQGQSEPGFVIPGTIAIEDLDKLEGIAEPDEL
jgi:hypothetical protein